MLMNRFSRENVLSFWNNLGTKHIFTRNTIGGITSAKDASSYMKELYRFSRDNNEYGSKVMEYFKGADCKLITDINGKFNTSTDCMSFKSDKVLVKYLYTTTLK